MQRYVLSCISRNSGNPQEAKNHPEPETGAHRAAPEGVDSGEPCTLGSTVPLDGKAAFS